MNNLNENHSSNSNNPIESIELIDFSNIDESKKDIKINDWGINFVRLTDTNVGKNGIEEEFWLEWKILGFTKLNFIWTNNNFNFRTKIAKLDTL